VIGRAPQAHSLTPRPRWWLDSPASPVQTAGPGVDRRELWCTEGILLSLLCRLGQGFGDRILEREAVPGGFRRGK
jgi:hypothetical protein